MPRASSRGALVWNRLSTARTLSRRPTWAARNGSPRVRRVAARHKGIDLEGIADIVHRRAVLRHHDGRAGLADGMVSGPHTRPRTRSGRRSRSAGLAPDVSVVSSVFFMRLCDQVLVYGDCAVNPDPTAEQLADIASGVGPDRSGVRRRAAVAMLSYSTGGSGPVPTSTRSSRPRRWFVSERRPRCRGSVSSTTPPSSRRRGSKRARSQVAGRRRCFIFPDLNTGNNTYKAVQRSAGAWRSGRCSRVCASP